MSDEPEGRPAEDEASQARSAEAQPPQDAESEADTVQVPEAAGATEPVEAGAPGPEVDEPEVVEPRGAVRVRRAARVRHVLGRAASTVVVLALPAGVLLAGERLAAPAPAAAPSLAVPVDATATTLVCPGPLRLPTEPEPGEDVAYDPQFDPALEGSSSVLAAVARAGTTTVLTALGAPDDELGDGSGDARRVDDASTGVVVRAEPEGDVAPEAAAAVLTTTTDGDLRGLAAASCRPASTEAWLVGGSTSVGSSARLVLQNPGRTAATVTVELWGAGGPVDLAGAPTYLVPPGTERVVLLEGVAADQRRAVVRATASGGAVAAYVQDSELRGLTPAGVDLVVPGARPATRQTVPGVALPASEPGDVDVAQLRLLAPGDEAVRADVTLLGTEGAVPLPGAQGVTLEPGVVVDVPLAGAPAGVHTVVVEADGAVLAGVLLSRPGEGAGPDGPPVERAWLPSLTPGGVSTLALPTVDGVLALGAVDDTVAAGDAAEVTGDDVSVELEVVTADGRTVPGRSLEVTVGSTTTVPLAELALDAGEDAAGEAEPAPGDVPVGVTVVTDDPRLVWAAVLRRDAPDGPLVSTLVPVAAPDRPATVGVRVR
ncbi:hypothetical protein GXB85_10335 [Cellulomonas sp. APG4]|uniref:DUF5719 family protein n=1 Tax=Cellulomonas sp. APG4 TaxID=1538656 RepID=UPI00137A844D|nr:DUF5719 family protein [Cellulomonas sp. APG4]NCT91347.1 hypothetical protein [Cellulomonas sp. APG4]